MTASRTQPPGSELSGSASPGSEPPRSGQPRSLLRNSVIHAFSSGSSLLLFVLLFLAGRWLGAEDFGRFSFALAFVFLFDFFFDPGLYHLLIREIARDPGRARAYLSHAMTWKLGVAPLALGVIAVAVTLLHDSPVTRHCVYLMAAGHVFHTLKEGLRSGLLGGERFDLDAVVLIGERVLLLAIGAAVLFTGQGVVALCGVFLGVRAFTFGLALALTRSAVSGVTLGHDGAFLREMIRVAVPMGAFYVTLNLYNYVDTVMLSALRNDVEVGWYNAGYRVYEGSLMLAAIIGTVFMPRLSRLFHEDAPGFTALLGRGLKYVVVLGLLASMNGIALAHPIITLPFGAEYEPAVSAFVILLAAIPAVYAVHFLQISLIAMDRQRVVLVFALTGLAVNVALNAALIPTYGYRAAAFSTAVVEAMLVALMLAFFYRRAVALSWRRSLILPLTAMALPAAAAFGLLGESQWLLRLAAVDVGFAALALAFGLFEPDERAVAARLLRRVAGGR